MRYWLLKTEPQTWSWADQVKAKKTEWDGVRNFQARNNLNKMQKNDLCMFYHSVSEKQIIGIVKVIKEAYLDKSDKTNRFVVIDIKTYKKLAQPVNLKQIKSDNRLSHIGLVKQGRLSVMPIDSKSWSIILKLAKTKI